MRRTVRDVMTRIVVVAPVTAAYKDVVRLMHEYRVSALPIVDDDGAITGVVSEADLLMKRDPDLHEWHLFEGPHRRNERRKAAARTAGDLMTSPPISIGPDAETTEAAHVMRERQLKHLPVVDERGRVLGVVSRVDLLSAFLRSDEVLADDAAGVVARATQDPEAVATEVHDGVVRVAGMVRFRSERERLVERLRMLEGVVAVEAGDLDFREDDTIQPVSPVPWVGF